MALFLGAAEGLLEIPHLTKIQPKSKKKKNHLKFSLKHKESQANAKIPFQDCKHFNCIVKG